MQGCFECTEAFILVSYGLLNWSVSSKTTPEAQKNLRGSEFHAISILYVGSYWCSHCICLKHDMLDSVIGTCAMSFFSCSILCCSCHAWWPTPRYPNFTCGHSSPCSWEGQCCRPQRHAAHQSLELAGQWQSVHGTSHYETPATKVPMIEFPMTAWRN